MKLTEEFKKQFMLLPIESRAELMQMCADELMTADEFHEVSKMPRRTIYAKFGTDDVKGFELCGHKIIYL